MRVDREKRAEVTQPMMMLIDSSVGFAGGQWSWERECDTMWSPLIVCGTWSPNDVNALPSHGRDWGTLSLCFLRVLWIAGCWRGLLRQM